MYSGLFHGDSMREAALHVSLGGAINLGGAYLQHEEASLVSVCQAEAAIEDNKASLE